VDLNFEDLRQRMSAFTAKFDAFIEKGRKRVLEERNSFRGRLGELNGACFVFFSGGGGGCGSGDLQGGPRSDSRPFSHNI
jgi:hypothetical protein